MNLKRRQMSMLDRMRRMAAKRRKNRKNRNSPFANLVPFRGNSVVVKSWAVKPGQTKSNRSGLGSRGSAAPSRFHLAKNMLEHLTKNDLRYNRRLGGAKPVKVCQSDCVGLQSASRHHAGGALGLAARRHTACRWSLSCRAQLAGNSALFRTIRGTGAGRLVPSASRKFRPIPTKKNPRCGRKGPD